jgi:uncharacterized Ntn-hydrolase superfamily protein
MRRVPSIAAQLSRLRKTGWVIDAPRQRLAATYSIVARDSNTGELGVAVQSNYFSVGTDVTWAEPGVGAVATQAIVDVAYGPRGLALMSKGATAQEALDALVAKDPSAALRQVGMVDAEGRVAAYTGLACVPARADVQGDGFSVQGNMLKSDSVWQAMGPAFEAAEEAGGDLAERLMIVLEAAEEAGGDLRGRQSAALLVVSGDRPEHSWEGRLFDLHVEDHPRPLKELRRLLTVRRSYADFERAREKIAAGDIEAALVLVGQARELNPDDMQFSFWTGVALANLGRADEARHWLNEAFDDSEVWRELGRRLCEAGMYSGDRNLLEP